MLGGSFGYVVLSQGEMPETPVGSLSAKASKRLPAGTPCVSDCCVEIHNLFEYCTEGSCQLCPSASCSWCCRMGKVILLEQGNVEEVRGCLTTLLYLAWLNETHKNQSNSFACFCRKAKTALIKRPFVKRPLSKILCKGAFTDH